MPSLHPQSALAARGRRLIRIVDVINANMRMRESACMEFVNAAVAPSLCYVLLASTWFTTRFT